MRGLTEELVAIILLLLLIGGLISNFSYVFKLSSAGSEHLQYGINKVVNTVKSGLEPLLGSSYRAIIVGSFIIDTILDFIGAVPQEAEEEASEETAKATKAVIKEEKKLIELFRRVWKWAKRKVRRGLSIFRKSISRNYIKKKVLIFLEKWIAQGLTRGFYKCIRYKSTKTVIRGGYIPLGENEDPKDLVAALKAIEKNFLISNIVLIPSTIITLGTETLGAAIVGVKIPASELLKEAAASYGRGAIKVLDYSFSWSLLFTAGLDAFTDIIARDLFYSIESAFYSPISLDLSSKNSTIEKIYKCYTMVGAGKKKVEYLRPTPTSCYEIRYVSTEGIFLDDIKKVSNKIDIPIVVCKITNKTGTYYKNCSKIFHGNEERYMDYNPIQENLLTDTIHLGKVILVDKDGNLVYQEDLDINRNISWIFISYAQCIDWDDMTWGGRDSITNPKFEFVSTAKAFAYGFLPIFQNVCPEEAKRGVIFVMFYGNLLGNENVDIEIETEKVSI